MDIRLEILRGAVRNRIRYKYPFILSHLVTERCNCSCPFCYWKSGSRSGEVPLDEIGKFYLRIRELGTTINYIWGGEPFIREDIDELLELSRNSGFLTIVNTNGSLAVKHIDVICGTCHYVIVSVDGVGEKHDRIRGEAGLFKKVCELIEVLKARGISVYGNTLVTKLNYRELPGVVEFYRSAGMKGFFNFMETGFPSQDDFSTGVSSLGLNDGELRETSRELLGQKSGSDVILNSRSYYKKFIEDKGFKCRYQNVVLQVRGNGDIENCAVRNRPFGNILRDDIRTVLNSRTFARSRKETSRCNNCRVGDVIDTSYLYDLKPEVIWNFFRNLKSEIFS